MTKVNSNTNTNISDVQEVTIKVIRLIVNLSIRANVGKQLSNGFKVLDLLLYQQNNLEDNRNNSTVSISNNITKNLSIYHDYTFIELLNSLLEYNISNQSCLSLTNSTYKSSHSSETVLEKEGFHEECMLNIVAAWTNLSYYMCDPDTVITAPNKQIFIKLCSLISVCIFHVNMEIVLECCRVLGM